MQTTAYLILEGQNRKSQNLENSFCWTMKKVIL